VEEQTLRWPGGWARLGPWRGQEDVAYLSLGADRPPEVAFVDRCLQALRRQGYRRVVTSALAPAESLPFVDSGFAVHERLHLLEHRMAGLPDAPRRTRRARRGDRSAILEIDGRAFDDFWHIDARGFDHAVRATPNTRVRVGEADDAVVAYAITGRAGDQGFLQRLAVDPATQRGGWGRTLVADSLRWLRRHGVARTLVNTQLGNDAALALYRSCGFDELPVGLTVLARSL
jgi:ribosomal-protein-alanine N-acetyltransferase